MVHTLIRDVLTLKNWILFMRSLLLKNGTLTEPANQPISCVGIYVAVSAKADFLQNKDHETLKLKLNSG